jgi:hypothetical protein
MMFSRNSLVRQWGVRVPRAHRGKIAQAANPAAPPNPLSQLFLGIALISVGFVVLALAALVGTKLLNPGGYPDPFVPHQSIISLPGQSIAAVSELPCRVVVLSSHLNQSWCDFMIDTEHFRSVEVVSEQGVITQVWFAVKSLQVVDVVQRWGPPQQIKRSRREYIAIWDSGLVAYCALGRRFHNQLAVKTLLFRLPETA